MFYDNYVRLCNSKGKTPSAVALEIGIAKPTVSRWKGGSKPNRATILKVADYFGVPAHELTGWQKEKPPAQGGGLKGIDKLTPDNLEQAQKYIDFLIAEQQNS